MHKAELLEYLCGDICPSCKRPKTKYLWTCADCYRPHGESPEHKALSDVCDDHMRKADTFITMVRAFQKPESD